ncbi:NACHT domain-containing protein [Saccharothrix sp. Mg75]|uniref:NACHT domain-containing protein n=1 Tax=Saccharothrix sp. Mg75 TaxID=3445357 RepID=UPI003EEC3775
MARADRVTASNHVEGQVLGPSVQAGVIHGGVHFAAPAAGTASDEVVSLLRAQVQAAQELPRLLPGARHPALTDVYVRQDLGSAVEDTVPEPSRPTPILDGHGQLVEVPGPPVVRVAVRPPVRTVRDALDGADHLVVTGGAGQGKSTLSLRLAAEVAASRLHGGAEPMGESVLPLRLTARELAARLDLPFPEALADSVRADYGAFLRKPVSADVLAERFDGRRWLLLVDGLDEVADSEDRYRLVKVLASCAADPHYRVVLTTRPIEGALLAPLYRKGAVRYELQAFDDETLRRFAENWFADEGPDPADRFLRQIRAAHLDDLVRVPLLATIAAIVFQQRTDLPLPDNQYELYEEYFSFLRTVRPADSPFEPHRARLLEHLGLVRVRTDTSLVSAARDWVRDHVSPERLPAGWPEALTAFLVNAGPLVVRGDGDLAFLHHSFAEHLAATATASLLPETFAADQEDFAHLLHAARPEERGRYARSVALHYTRLRPDQADPLLRSLHAGSAEQHLLAARLLSKRVPAGTPTVDAFLDTVRGWATTTHYLAGDILDHACRTTQHPGLAVWLVGLMREGGAPLSTRCKAAAALSVRLRGEHLAEATRFLHALVDDAGAPVDVRLAAAEALSDSGTAERAAAERGLRSVLDDDAGSGADRRAAAVVLASFEGDARDFAVTALTRLLDDRDTAPEIVVEAATGLVEIGSEFHARAAEAFRLVLHDRVHSEVARGDAALGMASLGPDGVEEAVTALTAVVKDRRRTRVHRVSAAEVLGRLGQDHRQAAGESVLAMLAEPDVTAFDRHYCVSRLAGFGPAFRAEAEYRLLATIADPGTDTHHVVAALDALGHLGAEHLPEVARRLWDLLDEVRPDHDLFTTLLGHLADLGEPHRTAAVERLLAHLADGGAPATSRCRAASRLIDTGPEVHAKVARHLLSIAEVQADPIAVIDAWRELVKLGPQFHARALDALLHTTRLVKPEPVVRFIPMHVFASSEADSDLIADAMSVVIDDPDRTYRERFPALHGLVGLGPRFHRRTADSLCALLRGVKTMYFDFRYAATVARGLGIGLREDVAQVLVELMGDPRTDTDRVHAILLALEVIGFADTSTARIALRAVIDHTNDALSRLDAREMLLSLDPGSAPAVADHLLSPRGIETVDAWQHAIAHLSALGVEVAPMLRALLTHPDVDRRVSWMAALHLATSFPEHREEALAALRRQLANAHLQPTVQSDALRELAQTDPTELARVVEGIAALVGDERLRVIARCKSAVSQAQVDRYAAPGALALLERLADDPRLSLVERAQAVRHMLQLGSQPVVPRPRLLAVAAAEAKAGAQRRALFVALPRGLRTQVERTLLDDRVLPIRERMPDADIWGDLPLAGESTASAREVLTAPEFLPRERIDAALKLAKLDIRTVPEMTAYLEGVPADSPVSTRAKQALILLGTPRGREVRRDLERTAQDPSVTPRRRATALAILRATTLGPRQSLTEELRRVVNRPNASGKHRVEALLDLGPFDGLGDLRALRDDPRTPSPVRRQAAHELTEYQPEDWTAAAGVFEALAADRDERPALRWRAARDLAARGLVGRDRAVELLRTIARDSTLPVGARARAAATLREVSPNTGGEVSGLLRDLLVTDEPLLRRLVLLAIGETRPDEAALELLVMARDERHGPVARVWCAQGAVRLWRACRDGASVVVREVASDVGVPRHVRRRAACFLARWSEVCREEARAVIRSIDVAGRG